MERKAARGFTLIELLIGLVVLAIVMSLAVAGYGSAMQKTRRGAAQGCLMEAAQVMERAYTTNMTYALAKYPDIGCTTDLADFYTFDFVGTPDADGFVVQAVPTGSQVDDTLCATMSFDQAGVKTEGGTATDVDECW